MNSVEPSLSGKREMRYISDDAFAEMLFAGLYDSDAPERSRPGCPMPD